MLKLINNYPPLDSFEEALESRRIVTSEVHNLIFRGVSVIDIRFSNSFRYISMLTKAKVPSVDVILYRDIEFGDPNVKDATFDIRRSFGTSGFINTLTLFKTKFGEIF
jgi:hypothetical protein